MMLKRKTMYEATVLATVRALKDVKEVSIYSDRIFRNELDSSRVRVESKDLISDGDMYMS